MEKNPISPLMSQMFLTQMGLYCSERLSNDLYFLINGIRLLLPTFDEKIVKIEFEEKYGNGSWERVMLKLKKLNKKIAQSKTFYDALTPTNQSLSRKIRASGDEEEKIQSIFRKFFFKTSIKISLLNPEIYNLFVFLVSNSTIERMMIKNEYFKNLEQREGRKATIDNKQKLPGQRE